MQSIKFFFPASLLATAALTAQDEEATSDWPPQHTKWHHSLASQRH